MVNNVALLSPTGKLGSLILAELLEQQKNGKVGSIIVLHRASSDVSAIPASVEKRVIDYDKVTPADLQVALKNVDVLISAINGTTPAGDQHFHEALAAVKTLGAYIPSDFALNYTSEEEADVANVIVNTKSVARTNTAKLGVPTAQIHNGIFEFAIGLVGIDPKGNKLEFYPAARDKAIPVTGVPYLAKAVAQLATRSPQDLAGKTFTVVEYTATGQQLVDAFTKANGAAPEVKDYTKEDAAAARASGPVGVLSASVQNKWAFGEFVNDDPFAPVGVAPRTVEHAILQVVSA